MLRSAPVGFESLNPSEGRAEAGNFGVVRPYRYVGDDDNLRSLVKQVPNNYIMLKEFKTLEIEASADSDTATKLTKKNHHARETFENEVNIVQHLQNNSQQISNPMYARGAVIELDNGEKRIASEFIFYGTKSTKDNDNIPVASNLNDYLQSRLTDVTWHDPKKDTELKKQLSGLFTNITEGIHTSQSQIHGMGVLHLDTALRNFMLSTDSSIRLIDFGLSRVMPENGIVPITFNRDNSPESPRTRYDKAAYSSKKSKTDPNMRELSLSIRTDLFAKKFTLMELACVIMGGNEHSLTKGLSDSRKVTAKKDNIVLSDQETLQYYLNNLIEFGETHMIGKRDPRNPIFNAFIASFREYLTHIPEAGASKESIIAEDQELFKNAMADFRSKLQISEAKATEALAELVENRNDSQLDGYSDVHESYEDEDEDEYEDEYDDAYEPIGRNYNDAYNGESTEDDVKNTPSELFSEIIGIMKGIHLKSGAEKADALTRLLEIMKENPDDTAYLNAVRTHNNHSQIPLDVWKEIASISEDHKKFVNLNSHIKIQLQEETQPAPNKFSK